MIWKRLFSNTSWKQKSKIDVSTKIVIFTLYQLETSFLVCTLSSKEITTNKIWLLTYSKDKIEKLIEARFSQLSTYFIVSSVWISIFPHLLRRKVNEWQRSEKTRWICNMHFQISMHVLSFTVYSILGIFNEFWR